MPSIPEQRMARYRALAEISSLDMPEPAVRAIYRRMRQEGAPVTHMRDERLGMFMAPLGAPPSLADIDIACVGVPMENSVPLRRGTRNGPAAVREWSQWFGPVHEIWRTVPFDMGSVHDLGDVAFASEALPDRLAQLSVLFDDLARHGVAPLAVGGEHTMTFAIMQALGRAEPLGMIQIDAHADTGAGMVPGDEAMDSINDASPFRHAVLAGVLDPERCIQIGLRGRCDAFWDFSRATGMRMVSASELHDRGAASVVQEAREVLGAGPVYVTVDADGIDPGDLPGTGLPEAFGVSALDARRLLRGLRGLDVVGADFVELSPDCDPSGHSANVAAGLCFEMLCLLSEARAARGQAPRPTRWQAGTPS